MVIDILAKSWRLVWAERRLMLIPLAGGILALILGCFALTALGLSLGDSIGDVTDAVGNLVETASEAAEQEVAAEGEEAEPVTLSEEEIAAAFAPIEEALENLVINATLTQWFFNVIQGFITFFIQFATLTAIFRVLANEPYAIGSTFGATFSRIGRVLLFALLTAVVTGVNTVVTSILASVLPGALAGLISLVLWVAFFVATFFLLPIAAAEETSPRAALARSWQLGRSVFPALIGGAISIVILFIAYGIAITLGVGLLSFLLFSIARGLVVLGLVAAVIAFAVYILSGQVFAAAYQAQLYQHAVAQLAGGAAPSSDPDIDEDAFHKPSD